MSRREPLGRRSRARRVLLALAALVAALAAWVAFDLNAPRSTSLRDFDPDEVARLETATWRSYYNRERARLRAEAMDIRDAAAERGRTTEDDWRRIDQLLHQSWRSLHQAVNQ